VLRPPSNSVTGALLLVTILVAQALAYSHGAVMAAQTSIGSQRAVVYQDPSSDDWPTYHRDMFRSGYDPATPQVTAASQNWMSAKLDGDVYAEPLIVGTDVIVATENNSVYELNATGGQTLWHTNLGTPVNGGVLPCGDINPSGITSTPVIDVSGRTIFLVAFLPSPQLHHELFALNLDTGSVRFQLAIDPSGANILYQQQRAALALANGYVYVGYGGLDGDCGPYHGWLAAINATGGGPVLSYQVPTGRAGAIWGGGDGPVVDSLGNLLVATGNSDATSTFDFGDAVLKLSPATTPPIRLIDWFAPPNWSELNSGDLDLGSTEPVILSSNYLFQIGKQGIGYLLNANNLGNIGGQLFSSQVCNSGDGAYGGLAYSSPYLIVPCDNGLVALNVNLGSNPTFTVAWRGPNFLSGPPIIAGNAVWDVDAGNGVLYALNLTNGHTIFQDTIGTTPTHFNSVSAGDRQIFVTANRHLFAYLPQAPRTVVFHTTPLTFLGASSPGNITVCAGTFTDGQSTVCPAIFSATANPPSPSASWQFDHWTWSDGVTCTLSGNTASCSTSPVGGSLTAIYAAQVRFQTSPSSSARIAWGSCAGPGEGSGDSIFSASYGSVSVCYVPSGYTLGNWSCSDGLTCSGSNDPTQVPFIGPGTITLNLKIGSLTNPVSTSLTASATPSNPSNGTTITVSGTLTANDTGLGGKTVVLVFGWSTSEVTVTTLGNGSYTYTAVAPATAGPYNVDAFFLGDYSGSTQYLPSKATAKIMVT